MITSSQSALSGEMLMAMLPILIVAGTVVLLMLSIAWRRHHFFNGSLTVIGLNCALFSLYTVWCLLHFSQHDALNVTPLLRINGYSIFYSGLVILASLATCTFAYPWLQGYPDNREEFYLLLLIATLGALVLVSAQHLAAIFLGIELIALPLFGLLGYAYQQNRSLEASIKYFLLSAAASSFLLFGMALLYAQTGGLSFASLGNVFDEHVFSKPLILAGMGMILVGFGFKLSLAPFQLWTPDVYQGAPAPVTAFLGTVGKIALLAGVMRFFLYVPTFNVPGLNTALSFMAVASIFFGNLMALTQNNIKRLLGYSSIAHFGYLMIGLIALHQDPMVLERVAVYIVAYLFSSLGVLGVVSLMSSPYKGADAEALFSYRGLFWHRPILAAVMTIMLLSLAGIPMTLGFIAKFFLLLTAVNTHLWVLTSTVVIGSAIALYYYLRITVSLFLSPPETLQRDTPKDWVFTAGGIVVWISALLVLIFGIYPQPLISFIKGFNAFS